MKTESTMPIFDYQLTMETLEPVATAIQNGNCNGYAQMNHLGEEALCLHHSIVHGGLMWSSTQNVTATTMRNCIWKWRAQYGYMNEKKKSHLFDLRTFIQTNRQQGPAETIGLLLTSLSNAWGRSVLELNHRPTW